MLNRKITALLLVAALVLTLASCVSTPASKTPDPAGSTDPTASPQTSEAIEPSESTGEKIQLRYMAWNLGTEEANNVNRQMLKKFEDMYPEVEITVVTIPINPDGTNMSEMDFMSALASQQNLPDIFAQPSIPDTTSYGWTLDISEYALNDPDYMDVVPILRENAMINGHVYAIPYGLHYYGMAFNLSIFEELNIDPPEYSYSLDELLEIIAATSTGKYRGCAGFGIENWGSFVLNDNLGFETFDGTGYNFSGPEYAQIVDIYRGIVQRGQNGAPRFVPLDSWLPEGVTWPWGDGYITCQQFATWEIGQFLNNERPFKGDMWPLPDEKLVVVPDYLLISSTTKHPEWAYKLASWMTFDKEGMLARIEMYKNTEGDNFPGVPIIGDTLPEVDEYFRSLYEGAPMFLQTYEGFLAKPDKSTMECLKVVPGHIAARITADTGILGMVNGEEKSLNMAELIDAILLGDKNLADYAEEMDRVANAAHQKVKEALKDK